MMLINEKQLNKPTPGKQCYAAELQLFIIVLDTLKQEPHARAETESSVNEVPTQSICWSELVHKVSSSAG